MASDDPTGTVRWLRRLQECLNGTLEIADFVDESADLLQDLPLYPPANLMTAGQAAGDLLDKVPASAVAIVLACVSSPAREVRAAAAAMLARLARYQPGIWSAVVKLLVEDDDWEVRDLAARCFDTTEFGEGAAEFHLAFVCDTVKEWVGDSSERVRRAATQALLGYAQRHPEFRPLLLDILLPLLHDERDYVQASHAAALRALGRADPKLVLDHMQTALDREPGCGGAAFALALQHSWAARQPDRRAEILARLAPASDGRQLDITNRQSDP